MNELRKLHILFQNTYWVGGALVSTEGQGAHVCADASFVRCIPGVTRLAATSGVFSSTRRFETHTRGARAHAGTPVIVFDRIRRAIFGQ